MTDPGGLGGRWEEGEEGGPEGRGELTEGALCPYNLARCCTTRLLVTVTVTVTDICHCHLSLLHAGGCAEGRGTLDGHLLSSVISVIACSSRRLIPVSLYQGSSGPCPAPACHSFLFLSLLRSSLRRSCVRRSVECDLRGLRVCECECACACEGSSLSPTRPSSLRGR
jgi:hypothetical protein